MENLLALQSQDGEVSIAQSVPPWVTGWTAWIRFPGRVKIFVLQTGSEAHPASYPMGTVRDFPSVKAAGA
jgi:hypothetical protein